MIIFLQRKANEKLKLYIEIGNLEYNHRIMLLEKLEGNGYSIKESSKSPNSMYTRIFTDQVDVEDWSSIEKVQEAIQKLINSKKFEGNISKINKSIEAAAQELGYQIKDF